MLCRAHQLRQAQFYLNCQPGEDNWGDQAVGDLSALDVVFPKGKEKQLSSHPQLTLANPTVPHRGGISSASPAALGHRPAEGSLGAEGRSCTTTLQLPLQHGWGSPERAACCGLNISATSAAWINNTQQS